MRRALGVLLIAIGIFGLALTVLFPTVVVDRSKKTPLDLDITQVSSGPAKLLDASTNTLKNVRLQATRTVRTDSHDSDTTRTTVFETLCIVIDQGNPPACLHAPDPRLLTISTDRVTADRRTAEAVHVAGWNENVNGDPSVRHTGLSYKWPIDAQKKTYQFFQPDLGKAFPARFDGTATIRGLTVYRYVCATGVQPYKLQGTIPGTYDDTRTVWVEPRTGAIVNGVERQVQKLADGAVALDTTLSFEKSAIDYQSNYAKDKIDQLRFAQVWLPIITGVVGVAALIGAFFLLRRRGPKEPTGRHGEPGPDSEPDPEDSDDPSAGDQPPFFASSSQT